MFSKARLDTLRDGIFDAAMTLLILDVPLPNDFQPLQESSRRCRRLRSRPCRGSWR
jgi:uncharacterized membrane protein